jgi:hypothetical protein
MAEQNDALPGETKMPNGFDFDTFSLWSIRCLENTHSKRLSAR